MNESVSNISYVWATVDSSIHIMLNLAQTYNIYRDIIFEMNLAQTYDMFETDSYDIYRYYVWDRFNSYTILPHV